MRTRFAVASATAALVLLAACAENPTAPLVNDANALDASASPAAHSASNGNGTTIERFPNIQFILIYDAESQLLSAHMPSTICGAGEFNVVDVMRLRTPSHVNSVVSTIKDDDSQAAVYHAESPGEAGLAGDLSFFGFTEIVDFARFCAFVSGPNLIAEGTVQSISTFSAASFHLRRTGTVRGVDGQDYHLTEVYQLNADAHDPNNPDTFKEIISRVSLTGMN